MTGPVGRREAITVRELAVEYDDPYANHHGERIAHELRQLEVVAAEHYGADAGHRRKRLSAIDLTNPATARLAATYSSFEHWLSQVPTAAALHPLYDPEVTHYASGVPLDDGVREWFRNIADARGIRSRAAVMRQLLVATAGQDDTGPRWLSLACGAAQPVFRSMEQVVAGGGPTPRVTLADLDAGALRLAAAYARSHGLQAQTVRANVLDRRGLATIPSRLPGVGRRSGWIGAFDAVDAVGILEYLQPDDWTYTYNGVVTTNRKQAGAITFVRNAFACVKPGGVLITGNMLDTHPQLGFTMDVIQWPHIQPRSIDEMLGIFEAAGIRGHVDVHLPTDGVYAVYVLRKD